MAFLLPNGVDPIKAGTSGRVHRIPDIIEFVVSDKYLNRPNLFPRQATILKTIFLQTEIFTQYDYDVLGGWASGFHLDANQDPNGLWRYDGHHGTQPDVIRRIEILKERGAPWFREVVAAIGRRGGKGYLGGIAGAYVLWHYLSYADPRYEFTVDRDKQLSCQVFGAKKQLAQELQWKDLTDIIIGGPCFGPFIGRSLSDTLTVHSLSDHITVRDREARGIKSTKEVATFSIEAKESTKTAGRGFASFMQFYDEMAHVDKSTASASAEEVYGMATPALDQFRDYAFIYEGSSTYQMIGQFYQNWTHSLQVDPQTRDPLYPDMLMFQLESWDPYEDWRDASNLRMRKGFKKTFQLIRGAPQEFDDRMRLLEQANPETFAIERRSRWAASVNAYLNPALVKRMWDPWNGREFTTQTVGRLDMDYVAHCDPSKSGANFGYAIAHIEGPDERGLNHVVFDCIRHWAPGDFADNGYEIDYPEIEDWLKANTIDAFMPRELSFDQFNSIMVIQRLRKYVSDRHRPKNTQIYERTATAKLNWKMAETFKYALGLGLLHGPRNEQAEKEMIFLEDKGHEKVDHPEEGEVQTKDVWDAMANVVYGLIGQQIAAFIGDEFVSFGIQGAWDKRENPPFGREMSPEAELVVAGLNGFTRGSLTTRAGGALSRSSPSRNTDRQSRGRSRPSNPWGFR